MSSPDLLAPPPVVEWPVPRGPGGGRLKERFEDFVVEEIPAYEPSGEGGFDYLWVEKTDVAGDMFVRVIAKRLGILPADVGAAGMKDRRAVTRQWISVPTGGRDPGLIEGPVGTTGAIRLLKASRHTNKLKTGHLHGNRFRIRVRGLTPQAAAEAAERLHELATRGFANAFGSQRFSGGETVAIGLDALEGKRIKGRRRLRLGVSALQASLFNHWLAARAADGLMERALEGDVLRRRESGGLFVCRDPATDDQRLADGELVVTGPLPGWKLMQARGPAGERETELLERVGFTLKSFAPLGKLARGTRRAAVAWPGEARAVVDEDGLQLSFSLDSGVYATVLCELVCGPTTDGRAAAPGH